MDGVGDQVQASKRKQIKPDGLKVPHREKGHLRSHLWGAANGGEGRLWVHSGQPELGYNGV